MIEFGCNRGRTAKALLDNVPTIERYIGIDVPFIHAPTLKCQQSEVPLYPGREAADDPRFFLLLRNSYELGPDDLEPCDAVFIDGDHSERVVRHDSELARMLLRSGGIIVWHDYGNETVEVTQTIVRLQAEGWGIGLIENSWLAFLRN
jgi:predicted O-methyltransferase YrrM